MHSRWTSRPSHGTRREFLLDPNIGALTQIVDEFKPDGTPLLEKVLVRNIDSIVKQAAYSGWNERQPGQHERDDLHARSDPRGADSTDGGTGCVRCSLNAASE
ncbi:unannotated protein [freshwater metagenome]|uniref:Unannotated protein n=1 Tax=freshwater metagenome TaxID=449393 RepID=A0A6J7QPW5_9ZZZZ